MEIYQFRGGGYGTDHDYDTLNLPHGQWSELTNFDHLTMVILKFWPWSWSKMTNFDHLTTAILKFWPYSWSRIFDHDTRTLAKWSKNRCHLTPPPPPNLGLEKSPMRLRGHGEKTKVKLEKFPHCFTTCKILFQTYHLYCHTQPYRLSRSLYSTSRSWT